jgi:hypothetical protein
MSWRIAVARLRQLERFRLRLLQPETDVHLTAHRRCGGEVLPGLLTFAGALIQHAEAVVAVGNERAHTARLGLVVVSLAGLGVEAVPMGRHVAAQGAERGPSALADPQRIRPRLWAS